MADLISMVISLVSVMLGSLTGLLMTSLVVLLITWYTGRPAHIPPGPRGVPFLGYVPFLKGHRAKVLNQLCKKYGPITSFYVGKKLAIVLGDYECIRKALVEQGDVFSGRLSGCSHAVSDSRIAKGLIGKDGLFWSEHRRFSLSALRDFGIGKASLEPAIVDEIQHFLDEVEKLNGEPCDVDNLLSASVCNNICLLNFGRRFEYNDPQFLKLKHGVDALVTPSKRSRLTMIPFLRFIPGMSKFMANDKVNLETYELFDFMDKERVKHLTTYHEGKKDDFIDAYFTERKEREQNGNHPDMFDDDALLANLRVLFLAGMVTTTSTLRWGLLYMILHPDVQRKVQQEIDDVIGRQRTPTMEDRLRMPYTEATLLELQRVRTIVPLSVPHRVMKDTELNGFSIPAGTMVLPNLWAVHNDDKLFPDPSSFRPERFINEHGQVKRSEHIIPFSIGKRQCLGEALARMELFLYFTLMLQRFTFSKIEGAIVSTDIATGITDSAKPFRVHAIRRAD